MNLSNTQKMIELNKYIIKQNIGIYLETENTQFLEHMISNIRTLQEMHKRNDLEEEEARKQYKRQSKKRKR